MKKLRSYRLTSSLCAVLLMLVFASCKDDKEKSATHDPNKPITLTNFYPTNGGVATKLILNWIISVRMLKTSKFSSMTNRQP